MTSSVKIAPLHENNAPAWTALFTACGCACFCRYWHFAGTKNEWLARSGEEPWRNRDEQLALVERGDPAGHGLLALDQDEAVGWMKLVPRASMSKLRRQGAYRPLDLGDDEGIWSIGCLLVHPARRRQGIARSLVEACSVYVADWGGRAVEAYPRRVDYELHDEQAWMGTATLFAAAGFREIAGQGPYPVLRKAVSASASRTR